MFKQFLSFMAAALVGGSMVAGATVATAPAAQQTKAPYDLDSAGPISADLCERINAKAAEAGSAQALVLLESLSARLKCDPVPFANHVLGKR